MINFNSTDLFNPHQITEHLSHLDTLLALWLHSLYSGIDLIVGERWALVNKTEISLLLHFVLRPEESLLSKSVKFLLLWV